MEFLKELALVTPSSMALSVIESSDTDELGFDADEPVFDTSHEHSVCSCGDCDTEFHIKTSRLLV